MIPLSRPYFDQDELLEINKVLESGWVSQGPKVREFEAESAKKLGVAHAVCVSNCTAALHLSLLSIGVGPGDEVIVADYTFPATGHSVLYSGAKPVFVDVKPDSYNIDIEKIESAITTKTKAIIPVHTFGQPADMNEIMDLAKQYDLRVIEDAACSFGATYKGRQSGTIGDVGCYSFHARKGITTGEGGMMVTNDDVLAEKVRYLAVFGMKAAWDREKQESYSVPEFHDVGYNYKMSDITAAVGVAQLRKLDHIIAKKRELSQVWDEVLSEIHSIEPPYRCSDRNHIFQSYVAKLVPSVDRNRLIVFMRNKGVQTQMGTYASHIQPVYGPGRECSESLKLHNQSLALPFFFEMTEEQIIYAGDILRQAIEACR